MTTPEAIWNFLICLSGLSYGYNIWPKRVVPVAGPDKKGRGALILGYMCVGVAIVQMFLLSTGLVQPTSRGIAEMRRYRQEAAAGNYRAMYHIGVLYEGGGGVPQCYPKAIQWFESAAAGGVRGAMFQVGWLYEKGYGAPRDYKKAMVWYRRAAAKNSAAAMFMVGDLYYNGHGVHRDFPIAVAWWQKAGSEGNKYAMIGMAAAYGLGRGVPQNKRKAIKWLQRAAAAGSLKSKHILAEHRPEINEYLMQSK